MITQRSIFPATAVVQSDYDNAGNLIKDHRDYSYIYDYENRLIQIYIDDNLPSVYDDAIQTLLNSHTLKVS